MATSKSNAKKLARTVLTLSTVGTKYKFLTRPGMNNWIPVANALPGTSSNLKKKG